MLLRVPSEKVFDQSICRTKGQKARLQCLASEMPKSVMLSGKGVRKEGLGLTPPPPLNLLCYKNVITYAKEFVYVFAHFLLVWYQLNAKTTQWFCMKISRNTVNGPKRNNYILVGIWPWVIACIQEPSHHFLQTSRRLRIFMLVLRDSSLYSQQLSLFCQISACADGAGLTSLPITVAW